MSHYEAAFNKVTYAVLLWIRQSQGSYNLITWIHPTLCYKYHLDGGEKTPTRISTVTIQCPNLVPGLSSFKQLFPHIWTSAILNSILFSIIKVSSHYS